MKKPTKRVLRTPAPVTFEAAMKWLRRGYAIRRRAWHPGSYIFRAAGDVFVVLPVQLHRTPQVWRPYPQDFLAIDWARAARRA